MTEREPEETRYPDRDDYGERGFTLASSTAWATSGMISPSTSSLGPRAT